MTTARTTLLIALVSGLLFGLGLSISGMVNPARVLGFLDVAGVWDPTLAFVMAGALLVSLPVFQYAGKLPKPLLANKFSSPTRKNIDVRLLAGAAIFGVGWGLAGLCPGPALVGLATLQPKVWLFVISMLVGMLIYQHTLEK